jgi:hypothetical protein
MGCNHFVSVFVDLLMLYSRRGAEFAENFKVLFLPQTPLRTSRLGEILLFFSLAEAQRPQRISMFLFLPQTPLLTLRPGEILLFLFSQRRQGRQVIHKAIIL